MPRAPLLLALLLGLAACGDGQPIFDDGTDDGSGTGTGDGSGDGGGVTGDPELPPGTDSPTTDGSIVRFEGDDGLGGGYVQDVSYDAKSDTFFVDNLAFDGANVYQRGTAVSSLGQSGGARYAVYEANPVETDPQSGKPIQQLQYRAIYGVSDRTTASGEPTTQFAIVRTGSYVDFGFGGFVYQRNEGTVIPTDGQATYSGDYAGMRVFSGKTGLEYTQGDVNIDIDFRDFNAGDGVKGHVTNREAFDVNGNPISLGGTGQLVLPDLNFTIGPGTVTGAGEMSNGITSFTADDSGALTAYESGTYYAVLSGDKADEIVGVFVVTSTDPRYQVTAQETGGFIVYR